MSNACCRRDGALIALATNARIHVVDAATGTERPWADCHDLAVELLALSPDGRLVASSADGEVWVRDLTTGEKRWTLDFGAARPTSMEFLPDRAVLRTCDSDAVIRHWNLNTGMEEARWSFEGARSVQTWGALDGARVLVQVDGALQLWSDSGREGVVWSTAPDAQRIVFRCAFLGSARVMVFRPLLWPRTDIVEIRDANTGHVLETWTRASCKFLTLQETHLGPMSLAADIYPGRSSLLRQEWGGGVERWVKALFTHAEISADGRWLVGRDRDDVVDLWSLANPPVLAARIRLQDIDERVTSLAISADGSTFAVGATRGGVLVFSLAAPGERRPTPPRRP